jgi:hypothetical protein
MRTDQITKQFREASPRFKARMAGVFEMLEGCTSSSGQVFILGRLVVSGSAAATAANMLGHERLFWLGFVSSLIGVVCHIAWISLFYKLFKPVNSNVSLLAALVGIVVCAMQAVTGLLYVAPWLVLQGGSSLSAFTAEQLQALAFVFLKLNGYTFDIDLAFFGIWCVLAGYLIFRSGFLPRILGVLLAIDGVGLGNLSTTTPRTLPLPLRRDSLSPGGNSAATLVGRSRRELSTMAPAGQRRSNLRMTNPPLILSHY